jgi:hypothetical protein
MLTEELIRELSIGVAPVRRVTPPWRAATIWLGIALAVLAGAVAWSGLRHDLAERMALPEERLNLAAALLTGIAAAYAAFQLALPDRSARWALLPLAPAVLWVSGLGWGCLREFVEQGMPGMGISLSCTSFIMGFGIPMTLAMLWMARHAARIRPGPVAALGGLAAAAIGSVGLSLVHYLEAAAMVLAWHGVSIALVCAVSRIWGPPAMRVAARL